MGSIQEHAKEVMYCGTAGKPYARNRLRLEAGELYNCVERA